MKIAIVSPSQNAYSETFIQAHKNLLKGEVYYYFDGGLPRQLEGETGILLDNHSIVRRLMVRKMGQRKYGKTYYDFEWSVKQSFKKKKIQCVLAEYGPTGCFLMDICEELNIPLIVHFHGYDASITETLEKFSGLYQKMFSKASYIIAVSRFMTNRLIELGAPAHKVIHNVYGPNDLFFDISPTYDSQSFIAIGRFVDKKAPYYLVLAFKEVLEQFENARLIIAGNGLLYDTCQNMVRAMGLDKNIKLPGVITPQQYAAYLQDSIAFVQHSITAGNGDMEGTPLAVLEASAAGLPVISTKHAGIPDVIEDDVTGLLVEEHDVSGMAENMIKVLEDKSLAKEMGQKGKERIRKNFSMARHISRLDELIKSAVDEK
jgi:glycosyltransferase involved in cell wall biosynthesis